MFCGVATRTPSKSMAGLLVLLLCSFVFPSDATIRVVDSGTEYQSRPDKYVGLQMKVGVEYGARLQRIQGDLHLCGTGHWNVTAPSDGRPVALLVKKGLCSYAQKAEFASRNIHPRGIVKILIIDGEIRIKDDEYKDDDDYAHATTLQDEWKGDADSDAPISSYEFPYYYNDTNYSEVTLQKRKENDIAVALLHVSYRTGVELLDVILNEDPDERKQGGALLAVDGAVPPMTRTIVIIWTAVCVVVSILACCCLAGAVQELLETHEPEPEPPRRPRRQRLTIDQIRKIPVGIFDGSQLVYDDDEEARMDLECGEDSCRPEPSVFIQPAQHSLDACTICLDDYEIGDKLRCLPCGHAFHANCIAKWLYERSATCPLCNKDLYEEEEEEDDEEDEDETENDVEQQQGAPATPSEPEITENTTTTTESSGEPWWRTIFRSSRRQDRQVSEELTEPLLQQQQQEEEEVETERSEATSVQETPISEESNIDSSSGNEELADGASSD